MVQHGLKQFQNIFRNTIQICIAGTLLISESFDKFRYIIVQNGSEPQKPRTIWNYSISLRQYSSERF